MMGMEDIKMYYYEITIEYTSGKVSIQNNAQDEVSDTTAYCIEGIRAGWVKSFNIEPIEEEY